MWIALGEDDDVAGFDRDRLFADDIGEATPLSDHMIRDQMLTTWQDHRQNDLLGRRLGYPWRPARAVEERRAGKPDGSQHIGKRVGAHRLLSRRTSGPSGRPARCLPNP